MKFLIGALLYLILPGLILWGLNKLHLHQVIYRREERNRLAKRKGRKVRSVPQELSSTYKKRMAFARKDTRDIQFRKQRKPKVEGEAPPRNTIPLSGKRAMLILYLAGLVLTTVFFGIGWYLSALCAFMIYWVRFALGMSISKKPVKIIDRKMNVMYGIAQTYLKYTADDSPENKDGKHIVVEKWQDVVTPGLVRFDLGADLNANTPKTFMEVFNLYFGEEQTWVESYDSEQGHKGWNFPEGVLHIYAVPPLPLKAPFMEHYVLHEGVAWSYVPIGLGVEGGLVLPNPETGEDEHVIGFDFSGLQKDKAEEHGLTFDKEIVAAPQVLVAGRTGGGKAVAIDELIMVMGKSESQLEIEAQGKSQAELELETTPYYVDSQGYLVGEVRV